ncbi:unnamed protein product (mitochondrion) [Plasmodiophora brassicae]|uniref:Zinc-finger domain-containing protein n=1 Tax=Plasmodiophora brassicae TaxID=37360 RepID=A0A0G4J8L8_PLABS|nr:hypothetical protein PBRA_003537 [Plasmodiophora brassicae]SPQ99890.1 unnamed protein product [Plasmodiophora brassicae]
MSAGMPNSGAVPPGIDLSGAAFANDMPFGAPHVYQDPVVGMALAILNYMRSDGVLDAGLHASAQHLLRHTDHAARAFVSIADPSMRVRWLLDCIRTSAAPAPSPAIPVQHAPYPDFVFNTNAMVPSPLVASTLQAPFTLQRPKPVVTASGLRLTPKTGVVVGAGGSSCHHCKNRRPASQLRLCANRIRSMSASSKKPICRKKFCERCLEKFAYDIRMDTSSRWECPACTGTCVCAVCKRKSSPPHADQDGAAVASTHAFGVTNHAAGVPFTSAFWDTDHMHELSPAGALQLP